MSAETPVSSIMPPAEVWNAVELQWFSGALAMHIIPYDARDDGIDPDIGHLVDCSNFYAAVPYDDPRHGSAPFSLLRYMRLIRTADEQRP